jgi:hypothetical protein
MSVDHIVVNVSEEYHATCALKNSFVEFAQLKGPWLLYSSLISVRFLDIAEIVLVLNMHEDQLLKWNVKIVHIYVF